MESNNHIRECFHLYVDLIVQKNTELEEKDIRR